jgi:hypothetical protein
MRSLLLVCISSQLFAQTPPRASGVQTVFDIPSGNCANNSPLRYHAPSNKLYGCVLVSVTSLNGTWTLIAGGGGGGGTVTSVTFAASVGTVTGSPVTTSGTINYSFTAANVVSLFSTCSGTQYLGADGACHTPGSGSVTSISTTSPITGGVITTTGTIACATCVVASSPGLGIGHFAGGTQTLTSSLVVESDISLSNNTTNNVSISAHGFTPILPNDSTKFLNGVGAYAVPPGSGAVTIGGGSTTPPSPSYVQSNGATGVTSLAFHNNVGNGSLLCAIFGSNGTVTGLTVSDTLSTSFTLEVSNTANTNKSSIYCGLTSSGGADTISATGLGSFPVISIIEVAGYLSTVDATNTCYTTANPVSCTITTSTANDLIIIGLAADHSNVTYSQYGAQTITLPGQATGNDAIGVAIIFAGSAATYTSNVQGAGSLDNMAQVLVAFKVGASPSGSDGQFWYYTNTGRMYGPRYNSLWGLPAFPLP